MNNERGPLDGPTTTWPHAAQSEIRRRSDLAHAQIVKDMRRDWEICEDAQELTDADKWFTRSKEELARKGAR